MGKRAARRAVSGGVGVRHQSLLQLWSLFVVLVLALFAAVNFYVTNVVYAQLTSCEYLIPYRVTLVDHVEFENGDVNFLFKGNEPKNAENDLDYEGLISAMAQRAEEAGLKFDPDNVQLLVVSFNNANDPDTIIEADFFKRNPQLGSFENWNLNQWYDNPYNYDPVQVKTIAEGADVWGDDMLPKKIEQMNQLLITREKQPLAIYVHCSCGCDRTGEFIGAYVQQFMNYTYEQAIALDETCGRQPNPSAAWGVQWYCFYKYYVVEGNTDVVLTQAQSEQICGGNYTDGVYVVYAGVFLDDDDSDELLRVFPPAFPPEEGGVVHGTEMLVAWRPSIQTVAFLPWEKPIYVTVVGYAQDSQAQAVVVRASATKPGADDLHSEAHVKHVTISMARGTPAGYVNDVMLAAKNATVVIEPLPPQSQLQLTGRIAVFLSNGTINYAYYQ